MDWWMAFPIASIYDGPVHSRMRITVYQAVFGVRSTSPGRLTDGSPKLTKSSRVHSVSPLTVSTQDISRLVIVDWLLFSGGLVVLIGIFWVRINTVFVLEATLSEHATQGIIVQKNGIKSLSHPWVHTKTECKAIGGWALCSISARTTM